MFKEARAKRDEVAERLKKLQEGEGLAQRRQLLTRAWTWAQVQECQHKVAEYEQHLLVTVRGAAGVVMVVVVHEQALLAESSKVARADGTRCDVWCLLALRKHDQSRHPACAHSSSLAPPAAAGEQGALGALTAELPPEAVQAAAAEARAGGPGGGAERGPAGLCSPGG